MTESKLVTIIPCMGTTGLFSSTRSALLGLFFRHPGESFHLRQVIRRTGAGTGAVQRELAILTALSILTKTPRGNQTLYALNPACPILPELRGLILKTTGLADQLRAAIAPLAPAVRCAFVYGSFARGDHGLDSDVDVMVIGDVSFDDVYAALKPLNDRFGRAVNPNHFPPGEFTTKLAAGNHFLSTVMGSPKIFLVGDQRELDAMAPELLAAAAPDQRGRGRGAGEDRRP